MYVIQASLIKEEMCTISFRQYCFDFISQKKNTVLIPSSTIDSGYFGNGPHSFRKDSF